MASKNKMRRPPSQRKGRAVARPSLADFDGKAPGLPEPKEEAYDPNALHFIAIHEAGHAVAASVLGLGLRGVDIRRRRVAKGISLGFTDCPVPSNAVVGRGEEALPWLVQNVAGPLAEMRYNPDLTDYTGSDSDHAEARRLAAIAICVAAKRPDGAMRIAPEEIARNKDAIMAMLGRACESAADLIELHRGAIEAVAVRLIERESLTGAEVAAVVAEHPPDNG